MAEEGEILEVKDSCIVCGEQRVVIRAGYQYCVECGTRSQESQPILDFTLDYTSTNINLKRIASKKSKQKVGEIWTTWHAHNMILIGLTEELACCGTSEDSLKITTLKLWGNFLRLKKIAFFETNLNYQPTLPYGFSSRDLQYLYGIEKSKNKNVARSNKAEKFRSKSLMSEKKSALVKQRFQEFINSQTSDDLVASQTLADLKKSEAFVEKSKKIVLTERTKRLLKKSMTKAEIKKHMTEGLCGPGCKCLQKIVQYPLYTMKDRLSIINLYAILVLALRINTDMIQVGDLIRWCREGHISFGKYNHFFSFDMIFKKGDKSRISLFSSNKLKHFNLRKIAGGIAKSLNFDYIKPPSIAGLILRYVKELELPLQLYEKITRLMILVKPIDDYIPKQNFVLPDYEAIAMSYIIVTLKLLFGLDDSTEYENSNSIEKINVILNLEKKRKVFPRNFEISLNQDQDIGNARFFNWKQWMEYIQYRKVCLSEYHYPTRMQLYPGDCDKSELFLHHKKICKKDVEEYQSKNVINNIYKSILARAEDSHCLTEKCFPTFYCSLYPLSSYVETLLTSSTYNLERDFNKDIIEEDFSSYNLSYILNPNPLKKRLKILGFELLTLYNRQLCFNTKEFHNRFKKLRTMGISEDIEIKDCLYSEWINALETNFFFDQLKDIELEKSSNDTIITITNSSSEKLAESCSKSEKCIKLNLCYKKYWLRHYDSYAFSVTDFKKVCNDLPVNFSWLLKECAKTIESTEYHVYLEVCRLERRLMQSKHVSS